MRMRTGHGTRRQATKAEGGRTRETGLGKRRGERQRREKQRAKGKTKTRRRPRRKTPRPATRIGRTHVLIVDQHNAPTITRNCQSNAGKKRRCATRVAEYAQWRRKMKQMKHKQYYLQCTAANQRHANQLHREFYIHNDYALAGAKQSKREAKVRRERYYYQRELACAYAE